MKIKAVRLKEVGHFTSGVALEGLSGRLDVLAGPNELGKSTIFRAIDAAFGIKHSADTADVRALKPLSGGAPLVEIDFDTGGTSWRLRKRYLSQKSAELTDLGSAGLLRGGDAEERLRELLDGPHQRAGMRHLLWVGQRQAHVFPEQRERTADLADTVGRLIEAEIADAASQGLARRFREDVTQALDGLVTSRGPKAQTAYKAAVDARDKAKAELEDLRTKAADAEMRVTRLEQLRLKWRELSAPQVLEQRDRELAALRMRRDKAEEARRAFDIADLVVTAKQTALAQADATLLSLTSAIEDEEKLRAQLSASTAALAIIDAELAQATASLSEVRDERLSSRQSLAALQQQLDAWDLHARQEQAQAALADLDRRKLAAAEVGAIIASIEESLALNSVDEACVAQLRRTAADVTKAEAKVGAALPKVSIDYVPGAAGRIQFAGQAIAASGEIAPAATVELVIEGVGRITIRAAVPAGEDPVADLDLARERFSRMCTDAGVTDIDNAEAQLSARQRLINQRDTARARLEDVASGGLDSLVQRLTSAQQARGLLGAPIEAPAEDRSAIVADQAALSRRLDQIESQERGFQSAVMSLSDRASLHRATRSNAEMRLEELAAKLPRLDDRVAAVVSAQTELKHCQDASNAAIRERSAWQAAVLTPAQEAALHSQIAAAEAAKKQAFSDQRQVELDIRGLESALERDRQDGIGSLLAEAQDYYEAAKVRVTTFEREVEELKLLDRLLNEAAEKARSQQLVPVVSRLQSLADDFLPGALFSLSANLRVDGIERSGQRISAGQMSGGMSEQIHVLVRLAYASLAADQGTPMPLILDDALVYADDSRYGAMLAAIAKASEHHQVIMLTCHGERTINSQFSPAMNVIELQPWAAA